MGGGALAAVLAGALAAAPTGRIVGEVRVSTLAEAGGLAPKKDRSNVVVYLTGFTEPPPERLERMIQKEKTFVPQVLPIVQGQSVAFENMDPLLHNVFSSSKAKPFDLGKYGRGSAKTVTFARTGLVDVYCDIHESMAATILVLPNRAFAITGADGRFQLGDLPPGEYTLFAWHRKGPPAKVEKVKVIAGQPAPLQVDLTETRQEEGHLDKYGRPYKKRGGY